MKKIITACLFLCVSITTIAQPSKDKKIKEFLDISGAGKMGVQMSQQIISSFKNSFKTVPSEYWDKVLAEINAAEMIDMVTPVYSKFYSEEEIDQLILFYKTPLGQKVISVSPQIMQESMQLGQAWGRKIGEKIVNELMENGYKQSA